MTVSSGFFNSIDGDRVYNAEDFSKYLEGIITNGCFPHETGLIVFANTNPIGTDPPSVIIANGKAYYDGMWLHNDGSMIFYLGNEQQTIPGIYHYIYICFDTIARQASIQLVTGTIEEAVEPPYVPGRYYLPLALVADQQNAQPQTQHITDLRPLAGIAGVGVDTESLVDESVTTPKIHNAAVTHEKLANASVYDNVLGNFGIKSKHLMYTGTDPTFTNDGIFPLVFDTGPITNISLTNTPGLFIKEFQVMPQEVDVNFIVNGVLYCKKVGLGSGLLPVKAAIYDQMTSASTKLGTESISNLSTTSGAELAIPYIGIIPIDHSINTTTLYFMLNTSVASFTIDCRFHGYAMIIPRTQE